MSGIWVLLSLVSPLLPSGGLSPLGQEVGA